MTDQGFGKASRLLNANDFGAVFNDTHFKVSNRYFLVLAHRNGCPTSRLGLVVAKKNIPTAVQRNRIKRQVRTTFRLHTGFPEGLDFVVLVRRDADKLPNREISQALTKLWKEAERKSESRHGLTPAKKC